MDEFKSLLYGSVQVETPQEKAAREAAEEEAAAEAAGGAAAVDTKAEL